MDFCLFPYQISIRYFRAFVHIFLVRPNLHYLCSQASFYELILQPIRNVGLLVIAKAYYIRMMFFNDLVRVIQISKHSLVYNGIFGNAQKPFILVVLWHFAFYFPNCLIPSNNNYEEVSQLLCLLKKIKMAGMQYVECAEYHHSDNLIFHVYHAKKTFK